MGKPYILVSSITYAFKGQKLLDEYGIKSSVERTPQHINDCSCGYSIRVNDYEADRAYQFLESAKIKLKGIYREADKA